MHIRTYTRINMQIYKDVKQNNNTIFLNNINNK